MNLHYLGATDKSFTARLQDYDNKKYLEAL